MGYSSVFGSNWDRFIRLEMSTDSWYSRKRSEKRLVEKNLRYSLWRIACLNFCREKDNTFCLIIHCFSEKRTRTLAFSRKRKNMYLNSQITRNYDSFHCGVVCCIYRYIIIILIVIILTIFIVIIIINTNIIISSSGSGSRSRSSSISVI